MRQNLTLNDGDALIQYSTGWKREFNSGNFNGDVHVSSAAGDVATISFNGTGIWLFGPKDTASPAYSVMLDDNLVFSRDLGQAVQGGSLFSASNLPMGFHSVKLLNMHSSQSPGNQSLALDFVTYETVISQEVVEPSQSPTPSLIITASVLSAVALIALIATYFILRRLHRSGSKPTPGTVDLLEADSQQWTFVEPMSLDRAREVENPTPSYQSFVLASDLENAQDPMRKLSVASSSISMALPPMAHAKYPESVTLARPRNISIDRSTITLDIPQDVGRHSTFRTRSQSLSTIVGGFTPDQEDRRADSLSVPRTRTSSLSSLSPIQFAGPPAPPGASSDIPLMISLTPNHDSPSHHHSYQIPVILQAGRFGGNSEVISPPEAAVTPGPSKASSEAPPTLPLTPAQHSSSRESQRQIPTALQAGRFGRNSSFPELRGPSRAPLGPSPTIPLNSVPARHSSSQLQTSAVLQTERFGRHSNIILPPEIALHSDHTRRPPSVAGPRPLAPPPRRRRASQSPGSLFDTALNMHPDKS